MQTFVLFPLLFVLAVVETKEKIEMSVAETRMEKIEKEGKEGRDGEVKSKKEQKRKNRKHFSVQSIYLCLFPFFSILPFSVAKKTWRGGRAGWEKESGLSRRSLVRSA